MILTLDGFGAFDPFTTISGVTFLYGTGLDEPSFRGNCIDCLQVNDVSAPEPASLVLLGSGLLGAAARFRRRRAGLPRG